MARDSEIRVAVFDIGTSSLKAGIIDCRGRTGALARVAYPLGTMIQGRWSAPVWELTLKKATAELLRQDRQSQGHSCLQVGGICFSGNGPTLIPLDDANRALEPVLSWVGNNEIPREGESSLFLGKLRWLRQEFPQVFAATRMLLSPAEYLSFRLGAQALTVCPEGDFRAAYWDGPSLSANGFDPKLFPPFVPPASLMGHSGTQAPDWGLPQGIPILAGGSDFLMSLLGSGTLEPGMVCDRAGSSEGINLCDSVERRHPGIRSLPHIMPGLYNNAVILGTTGIMFEWLRKLTGLQTLNYAEMMDRMSALPPDGSHPYFLPGDRGGQGFDFSKAMFLGLEPGHQALHLARAVVESIGFSIRSSLELLETSGARIREIRVCGGQSRNPSWNQMKADILGRALAEQPLKDAELLGDGVAAFVALGLYGNFSQGVSAMASPGRVYLPDMAAHRVWDQRFSRYMEIRNRYTAL